MLLQPTLRSFIFSCLLVSSFFHQQRLNILARMSSVGAVHSFSRSSLALALLAIWFPFERHSSSHHFTSVCFVEARLSLCLPCQTPSLSLTASSLSLDVRSSKLLRSSKRTKEKEGHDRPAMRARILAASESEAKRRTCQSLAKPPSTPSE